MKRLLLISLVAFFCLSACAGSMENLNANYAENSAAVKQFAKLSAQDWLFGSGIIQGALSEPMLPAWVFTELKKVDQWFIDKQELTEWQLGYIVGLRLRMAGPIIRGAVEQYAPGILQYAEVGAVLAFIGL